VQLKAYEVENELEHADWNRECCLDSKQSQEGHS